MDASPSPFPHLDRVEPVLNGGAHTLVGTGEDPASRLVDRPPALGD